jgi:hypothetical protein
VIVKKKHHLVVDGSNIATEGRQLPSLAQLEEALEAFLAEHKFERVTVVVDATFGHRINTKERRWYEEAVAANRIITPPAGAIGRGDAFILEIAKRAGATILSNDSFQEFHGDNAWLFDEGRLYGGKPIPHVGWVFVARSPVRGPTSRRAVKRAKDVERAEVTSDATVDQPRTASATTSAPPRSRRRASSSDKKVVAKPTALVTAARQPSATAQRADQVPLADGAESVASRIEDAPDASASEVAERSSERRQPSRGRTPKRFNELEKYERFRDQHPVGSLIEIVVERFSSHGAYARADDVEVYIPTKLLGNPPPQRARDVLHLGELVGLIVDRYDDATCAIDARAIRMDDDIAYYASARASTGMHESTIDESAHDSIDDSTSRDGSEQPTRRSEPVATKKAPAKKKAAAKKAPARKAAAKKAPARKAPAKKKATARKAPARKATARKAPAKKKATAKKAPARKAPAKKKATAKKAPARKATAKKAPARKAPARKAPAKRAVKRTAKRR